MIDYVFIVGPNPKVLNDGCYDKEVHQPLFFSEVPNMRSLMTSPLKPIWRKNMTASRMEHPMT